MFSTYSVGKISGLATLLCVLAAIPAAGQFVQDPPPQLSFLSTILKVRKNIPYEIWGEVKFPKGDGPYKQGKPAFLQNGWTLFKESRGGGLLEVLQYAKDGVQVWANVDTDGSPLLFRLDVIEI